MKLQQRINLLAKLGNYLLNNNDEWKEIKETAFRENAWFIPQFIDLACHNIATCFLQNDLLQNWTNEYTVASEMETPKNVGIVMAGNIPLVGFQDFLCVFVSGHKQTVKLSSKDKILLPHLVQKMIEWDNEVAGYISFAENLKQCDAYIATGSNNSGRYFEYYFGKYPSIIRKNRTSVAILSGYETLEDLKLLANDLMHYFGLGCRNVTKLFVPAGYDFVPLINVLKKYEYFLDYHKYKHNVDYQLAVLMMNNRFYMSSGALLFAENEAITSPIGQVNYSYYEHKDNLLQSLKNNEAIQCIVSKQNIAFGKSQQPSLSDYADGVDTMQFLLSL